jgi:hypothetical protein
MSTPILNVLALFIKTLLLLPKKIYKNVLIDIQKMKLTEGTSRLLFFGGAWNTV